MSVHLFLLLLLGLLYNFNNLLSNEFTYFLYNFIHKLTIDFLGVLSLLLNLNFKVFTILFILHPNLGFLDSYFLQ